MWYFAVAYFNWPVGLGIVALDRWRHGRISGLYCVAMGAALDVAAFLLHWVEWQRLAGQPDQLYVSILPFCLSIVAAVFVASGVVRSFFRAPRGGHKVIDKPRMALGAQNRSISRVMDAVEFELDDNVRFDKLVRLVDALAAAKAADDFRVDAFWEAFLDDDSKSGFWWPTEAEVKEWERRWFSKSTPQRWTDPDLKTPWEYGSLVEAVKNGEYELHGCSRRGEGLGAIEFEPYAHPFGGTGWMHAAIEAFGGRATSDTTV